MKSPSTLVHVLRRIGVGFSVTSPVKSRLLVVISEGRIHGIQLFRQYAWNEGNKITKTKNYLKRKITCEFTCHLRFKIVNWPEWSHTIAWFILWFLRSVKFAFWLEIIFGLNNFRFELGIIDNLLIEGIIVNRGCINDCCSFILQVISGFFVRTTMASEKKIE